MLVVLGAVIAVALLGGLAARYAGQAAARPIVKADRMRTVLLTAVSHDLRTPLAAAKAAVSCLRSDDIRLTAEDHGELLATADESLNQLTQLLAGLLDVSRLQAGALPVFPGRPIWRRSSRAASAASGRRHGRSWCAFHRACPGSWPIRRSWNGSSRT
jgi:two-component system sensor histidine kinase KdpD